MAVVMVIGTFAPYASQQIKGEGKIVRIYDSCLIDFPLCHFFATAVTAGELKVMFVSRVPGSWRVPARLELAHGKW